jgi:hypothetical protein
VSVSLFLHLEQGGFGPLATAAKQQAAGAAGKPRACKPTQSAGKPATAGRQERFSSDLPTLSACMPTRSALLAEGLPANDVGFPHSEDAGRLPPVLPARFEFSVPER